MVKSMRKTGPLTFQMSRKAVYHKGIYQSVSMLRVLSLCSLLLLTFQGDWNEGQKTKILSLAIFSNSLSFIVIEQACH